MNSTVLEHPTDDALTAFALGEANGEVEAHVTSCPACSRHVKELREVREAIVALPDDEVPRQLFDRIMGELRTKPWNVGEWFSLSAVHLLKNPIALVVGLILTVLLLYIFFVFVL